MNVKDLIEVSADNYDNAANVISLFLDGEFFRITPEESVSIYVLCQNWRDKLKAKADTDSVFEVIYQHFYQLNLRMQTHFLVNEIIFLSYGRTVKRFSTAEAVDQFCQMAKEMSNVYLVSNLWQEILKTLLVEKS